MMESRNIIIAKIAVIILVAMVSFFGVAGYTSDPSHYKKTLESLDDKKMTVAELTVASTGAAAAITLLPGDAGTPIAQKLVDMSGYFVIILSAIYLEKVLTTLTGYLAFRWMIPIGCILLIIGICLKKDRFRQAAFRIAALGLILYLLIPTSVSISNMIEKNYDFSVQKTIDDANAASSEIEENSDEEDENVLNQFINKVQNGVSGELEKFQALLSNFIDSIAMLIVTTCIIPIGVLLIMLVMVKQILGFNTGGFPVGFPVGIPANLKGKDNP